MDGSRDAGQDKKTPKQWYGADRRKDGHGGKEKQRNSKQSVGNRVEGGGGGGREQRADETENDR